MKRGLSILLSGVLITGSAAAAPVCSDVFEQRTGFEFLTKSVISPTMDFYRVNFAWMDSPAAIVAGGKPFLPRMGEIISRMPRKTAVLLAPVMPLPRLDPLERVFDRVWKNPDYELTRRDKTLLTSERLYENLENMRGISRRHPFVRLLSKWNGRTILASMLVAQGLLVNHAAEVLEGGLLDADEFLAARDLVLGETQIRLFNENHLWPKTALQVGEKVYFYQDGRLSVAAVGEYLALPSRVPGLARAVTAITLNLPAADVRELGVYLGMRRGGQRSQKWVNDGMTRVATLLGRHLPSERLAPYNLLDSSSAFSSMYFSLLKRTGLRVAGQPLVAQVQHVNLGSKDDSSKMAQFSRNIWLATIESNIVIRASLVSLALRHGLNAVNGGEETQLRADVERAAMSWKSPDVLLRLNNVDVVKSELDFQQKVTRDSSSSQFDVLMAEMKVEILSAALKDEAAEH